MIHNLNYIKALDKLNLLICRVIGFLKTKKKLHTYKIENIACIKLSAFGDALCLMPAIQSLKSVYPHSKITWITTYKTNPEYFKNKKIFDGIIVLKTNPICTLIQILKNMKKMQSFDLALDFDQSYGLSELLSLMAKTTGGFKTPRKGSTFDIKVSYEPQLNEKIQFLELVKSLKSQKNSLLKNSDFKINYFSNHDVLSEKANELICKIQKRQRPLLVIYPGSSTNAMYRRWPLHNYCNVYNQIKKQANAVFVGGPDESNLLAYLNKNVDPNDIWINQISIPDLAIIFSKYARAFLGNDGGLFQLAEAMDLPGVVIFGPSLASKWGSTNPLSINLEKSLHCRPCLQNYLGKVPKKCRYGTSECLTAITKDEVFSALQKLLK
jgi:ADP-heptose:LPS heptosyltransferase